MTSLFPDLRADLVGAMERGPRRRRAPVVVAVVAVLGVLAVAAAVTRIDRPARPAATPTPVDVSGLPPSIAATLLDGTSGQQPGTQRVDLRVNAGIRWTAVMYRARNGTIATTIAPDALRQPRSPSRGTSPAAFAESLRRSPIVAVDMQGVLDHGRATFMVFGLVDVGARDIFVSVKHRGGSTWTSWESMKIGNARYRLYAALLPGTPEHGPLGTAEPVAHLQLGDGSYKNVKLGRFCVTRRCGAVLPNLG